MDLRALRPLMAVLSLSALIAACGGAPSEGRAGVGDDAAQQSGAVQAMDALVSTEWLSAHLQEPDLVVLDCSVRIDMDGAGGFKLSSGRADYEAAHVPGAGFADLLGDLSDHDSPLRFAVPPPDQFARAMAALGVGDGSRVVLYDVHNSGWAARVWWMLRWIGFDRAAILDGGFTAWTAEERPVSTEVPSKPAGTLTVSLRPGLMADRDDVLAAIQDPSVTIIDVLPAAHYRGEMVMYGRPGHIPTAVNAPSTDLVDAAGRYRPAEEIRGLFPENAANGVITYCGGGIAASSTAFTLHRLGFTNVAVYTASLGEWAADESLPMETGDSTAGP